MGLFEKKECVNCGKMCGVFGRQKTEDKKILCNDCANKAGNELSAWQYTYDQYPALEGGIDNVEGKYSVATGTLTVHGFSFNDDIILSIK